MAYEPVSFRSFGAGLNLRDKTDVVSEEEAIDCLNVVYTERGSVKQRDGYAAFTSSALTNAVGSIEPFYRASGSVQVVAGCGTRLDALSNTGTVPVGASQTGLTSGTWDFARFGDPNSERLYAGQGDDNLQRWDGAAWTSIANSPKAGALAVMAVSNRLVAGRFNTTTGGPSGGTSSPSHVYFSDAGNPESYGANNYIQFTPGDGEKVQALVAWREFIFVFKESKFFVVYGETTDVSGNPVFNYRAVDSGIGLASPRAVCTTEDGVYFMDRKGVYLTTGGEPTPVSGAVDPIFLGAPSSFYTGGVLAHGQITNCAMGSHERRVYLSFPTQTTNNRTLVYDPRYKWWSLYDIPASSLASIRVGSQAELFFGYASGSNRVGRHGPSYTNDAGTAITSKWRSGWFDYGLTVQKTIRESKVWGTGKVYMGISSDEEAGTGALDLLNFTDASQPVWGGSTWSGTTWAATHGIIEALRRRASRGTIFSTYFTNSTLDQSWSVSRLAHHLREQRVASTIT